MRILVLSDIHGNSDALNAVLAHAGEPDAAWCLGDLVGYGADANECVEQIRNLPNLSCILGNHDAAVIGKLSLTMFNTDAMRSIEWTQQNLSKENRNWLAHLPISLVLEPATLVHGSPRNPLWEYILDPFTSAVNLSCFDTSLCLVGHSHLPIAYYIDSAEQDVQFRMMDDNESITLKKLAILNPGSVGQPRDHNPRASYAILDTETLTWQLHRVPYDVSPIQQRIRAAGLPERHAARLSEGW